MERKRTRRELDAAIHATEASLAATVAELWRVTEGAGVEPAEPEVRLRAA